MSVPYTIRQIDDAMRAISGERAVRPGESHWMRLTAMTATAAQAWIEQRPEDEHSAVLRSALQDLHEHGWMKPVDGIWPED